MIRSTLLACSFAAPLLAQDLLPKAAPQTRPILLQNATVHTLDRGTLVGGTIWFHDGVIGGVHSAD